VGTQGFSPRTRSDAQVVRFGAETGRVRLAGERAGTSIESEVTLAVRDSKRAKLNGEQLRSAEQLRHELQTLVFTPDRLAVVKGGPGARRAYVDRALARLQPTRAQIPLEYAAAVGQRNAALRRVGAGISTRDALAPWTQSVAALGEALVDARRDALSQLGPAFERCAARLGVAEAALVYEGSAPPLDELEARLDRDLERGVTGAGPHLHEIRIEAMGRDLRSFGSQGEQRIAVLALVLAEAEVIRERRGVPPLVLLDDVLSELDEDRRRALAGLVSTGGQVVITATSPSAFPLEPAQSLVVSLGEVRER
jgi:DNA replication and repair protein RecF